MHRTLWPLLLGALLFACGGDDSQPLSESQYFTKLASVDAEVYDECFTGMDACMGPSDDQPLGRSLDAAQALVPPASLQTRHDDLITAARAYQALVTKYGQSPEPTGETVDDEISAALAEWRDACSAILIASLPTSSTSAPQGSSIELPILCGYFGEELYQDGGDFCMQIAEGISGCLESEVPPLPIGTSALSDYLRLDADLHIPVTLGLALKEPSQSEDELGFYSFVDGDWIRIADVEVQAQDDDEITAVEAEFESVPANLIVLREN